MTPLILGLAIMIAVAAAVRSTWSPCGLSMLSTITPLAEQGRGYRYRSTAIWFVAGAVLGGATLGLGAAGLALIVATIGWPAGLGLGLAAGAATIAVASDLRFFGVHLPEHKRQVNEVWLSSYRSWVYGAGFGWQIGFGLATVIMTAAVYLLVVLTALTASPPLAFAVCTFFGLVRGLAIFLGARITTTEQLVAFHRRFDGMAESVRSATIGVEAVVAVVASGAAGGPLAALGVAVLLAAGWRFAADRSAASACEIPAAPAAHRDEPVRVSA